MGGFASTAAITGGERAECVYGGTDGPRKFQIREKVNLVAATSKTLTQRIPPRSIVSYCQLYNIDGISYSGTGGTATASRMAIVVNTSSAMATGTAAYSTILFIGGTSTAAAAKFNGQPAIFNNSTVAPLTNGQFEWTSSSYGYIHLVPISTSISTNTAESPIIVATNTAGGFFFSTNTSATNTGAVAVQLTVESFPEISV